jgi:hypothetical protein
LASRTGAAGAATGIEFEDVVGWRFPVALSTNINEARKRKKAAQATHDGEGGAAWGQRGLACSLGGGVFVADEFSVSGEGHGA